MNETLLGLVRATSIQARATGILEEIEAADRGDFIPTETPRATGGKRGGKQSQWSPEASY